MRCFVIAGCLLLVTFVALAPAQSPPEVLPGTKKLQLDEPLDVQMVRGINEFALREIELAKARRQLRTRDYSSAEAYQQQAEPSRQRFRECIGAVDERTAPSGFQIEAAIDDLDSESLAIAESDSCLVYSVRWPVLHGVTGEGLWLVPKHRQPLARVVAIPDADCTPESFLGVAQDHARTPVALKLVEHGCEVLVPQLISRDDEYSGHPDVRFTNQTHREFVYRTSFQVGRHVIGYEVQKTLAAVDQIMASKNSQLPIGVMGIGEGGLLAMFSAAVDPRIDATLVCGYFNRRDELWQEPIYRNAWGLLTEFGDAEIVATDCAAFADDRGVRHSRNRWAAKTTPGATRVSSTRINSSTTDRTSASRIRSRANALRVASAARQDSIGRQSRWHRTSRNRGRPGSISWRARH